jgi:hypothetical protein
MEQRDFEGRKTYLTALRRLTGEERLTLAFELRELVMEVATAGIRAQHPHLKDEGGQTILARRVMEANGAARILDSDASYPQQWADRPSVANSLTRLQKE